MMLNLHLSSGLTASRQGYTFIELIVSLGTASIIVGGLSSSLYIASQGFDQGSTAKRAEADEVLDRFVADVEQARAFSERTPNAVTFTVPNRDGDLQPDTIRYAWSGTPGDPLTYEYNGSAPESIAPDVQNFNLALMTRAMTARLIEMAPPPGGANLLLVVSNPASPTAPEVGKRALIESWGYAVTLIDDDDTQAAFDAALALNDVAYISAGTVTASLGNKLTAATLGVVNENRFVAGSLGLVADFFDAVTDTSLVIDDNSHYITAELPLGALTILTATDQLHAKDDDLAAGIVGLGSQAGAPTFLELATISQGAPLWGGGNAAQRRVQLPWGDSGFEVNTLTSDGQAIMQRSIEWAAGAGNETYGLVAHWKLDAATGLIAIDSVGGHNGTLNGGPIWTAGQIDGALDFDGSNDYVAAGTFDVTGSGLTMTGWLHAASLPSTNPRIVSKADGPNESDAWWQLSSATGSMFEYLRMRIKAGGTTTTLQDTTTKLKTGKWTFTVGTYDGASGEMKLYLDGTEVASRLHAVGGQVDSGPTVPVAVGANGTAERFFDGLLDDVRVYSRPLSAAEISQLFLAGEGVVADGNFGYETQFASGFSSGNGVQVGTQVTLPANGTLNSITAYIDPRNKNFRYAIYTDNGGEPGNLIVESAADSQSGQGWKTVNVTPTPLTAGTYWLALAFSHGSQKYYYESSGGTTRHKSHNAVSNGFISVWPGSTTPYTHKVSIYGTYSPTP